MTLKELNSLRFLDAEIRDYNRKIEELRTLAEGTTSMITGMPRGSAESDKVGSLACAIADYLTLIKQIQLEQIKQSTRIHKYISKVEDVETKRIMRLRFIEGKSWRMVAHIIGGGNTEQAVRMRVKRYIDSNN